MICTTKMVHNFVVRLGPRSVVTGNVIAHGVIEMSDFSCQ